MTNNPTRSVFTCILDSLLHSCHPPSQTPPHTNEAGVWQHIADVPMLYCTCTTLNGRVLAGGGGDSHDTPTADVYMYNAVSDSWPLVGHMSIPRSKCLVVGLRDCIIAVGGHISFLTTLSSAEVSYLQLSGGCMVIILVSQSTPTQPTCVCGTESDPRWGWLGLACVAWVRHYSTFSFLSFSVFISPCERMLVWRNP